MVDGSPRVIFLSPIFLSPLPPDLSVLHFSVRLFVRNCGQSGVGEVIGDRRGRLSAGRRDGHLHQARAGRTVAGDRRVVDHYHACCRVRSEADRRRAREAVTGDRDRRAAGRENLLPG